MKDIGLITIFILGILVFLRSIYRRYRFQQHTPTDFPLLTLTENDKIIVIKNIDYSDIKNAIKQFCAKYTKGERSGIVVSLTKISEKVTVVTFPYDLPFDYFCFLVNYLYYPENIFYQGDIKAWVTVSKSDAEVVRAIAGKKIMLYIPSNDTSYDNVYMITDEGIPYKYDFAQSFPTKFLGNITIPYESSTLTKANLNGMPTEEIR